MSAKLIKRAYNKAQRDGSAALISATSHLVSVKAKRRLSVLGLANCALTNATIEITNACNLNCVMCSANKTRAQSELRYIELGFFKSIINQFAELRVSVMLNFGGESLMHPKFSEILEYACQAKNRGLAAVAFFTNGMLLNSKLSKVIVDSQVDKVIFSLAGIGEVNDKRRLGSNYNHIKENIKKLIQIRGTKPKPNIIINIVDYGEKDANQLFLKEWLPIVDSVMFAPLHEPQFNIADPVFFNEAPNFKHKYCPYPFYYMSILADGTITGCCSDDRALLNLANVKNRSIKEVWTSPEYKLFRNLILKDKRDTLNPCSRCNFWRTNFKPAIKKVADETTVEYREHMKVYSQQHS